MSEYKYPPKWNIPELEEARQKVLEAEERVLKSLEEVEKAITEIHAPDEIGGTGVDVRGSGFGLIKGREDIKP